MNAEGRDKQMYGQDIYRHIKTRTNGHRDKDRHTAYKHRHGQTDRETDTHRHTATQTDAGADIQTQP